MRAIPRGLKIALPALLLGVLGLGFSGPTLADSRFYFGIDIRDDDHGYYHRHHRHGNRHYHYYHEDRHHDHYAERHRRYHKHERLLRKKKRLDRKIERLWRDYRDHDYHHHGYRDRDYHVHDGRGYRRRHAGDDWYDHRKGSKKRRWKGWDHHQYGDDVGRHGGRYSHR